MQSPESTPQYFNPETRPFILLLGLVAALHSIGTTLSIPAVPVIALDFGSSSEVVQFTISGYLFGIAAGQIVLGAISDRTGRRPVLLLGLLLFVLAGFGCTLAMSIEVLIGFRVLQGVGAASCMIVGRAIIRDVFERERALRAWAILAGIGAAMPMLGPLLAGLLLTFLPWRGVFGVLTAVGAITFVLAYYRLGESLRTPNRTATNPPQILANCLEMLSRPDSISFNVLASFLYAGTFAYLTLIPFIAIDTFGMTAAAGGLLVALNGLAVWIGTLANGRLLRLWSVRTMFAVTTGLALAAGLLTFAVAVAVTNSWVVGTPGLVLTVVFPMVFGMAFGAAQPNAVVMALHPLPHIAGTASALGATIQMAFAALSTWAAASLYNGTPIALGICLTAMGGATFLVFRFVARRYTSV